MTNPTNEIQGINQFYLIPEEGNIIKIFGFLDLKTLGRVEQVCSYFKRLQNNEPLWTISLGSNPWDNCVVDLRNKTITIPGWCSDIKCVPAMNSPAIPRRSFVVYTYGPRCIPCAVIKNKAGSVENIDDVRWNANNPFVVEFRDQKSQYFQIKSTSNAESNGTNIKGMQDNKVLKWLKNAT